MASIVRPAMLQKTCLSAASKRAFSTKLSTSFPAINKPSSTVSRKVVRNAFAKDVPAAMRVAAFHASGRKAILPPLPQVIQGTANDPAPVPPANPSHGSYHWTFERSLAVALVPLTITPFASGSLNPTLDAVLVATILLHSHIGFEACIIDYIPSHRLPKTRKLAWWALRAGTVLAGVGFYEFETNDVGVTEALKRIWTA
ncbi:CybS-domain-containing protein [Cadophora sp. MPI-SDFR-AT-0126]|nr:CybS-domain-containing protein [Leotiomycetes sp. MPI-SDFR-AT-0126]